MTASTDGSIRLGGLASGFDTEAIVDSLLFLDQSKIDRLKEDKEVNKAKIQTWEDIAEQFRSFSETVTKLKADGTGSNKLFDEKKVTSTTASVASAIAGTTSIKASYSLIVTGIAQEHITYGNQKTSGFTVTAGSFILNGATISTTAGQTLEQVAGLITGANYIPGEELVATVIDDRLVIQTAATGSSAEVYGTTKGASPPFTLPGDDTNNILETELEVIDATGNFNNVAQTSADASLTINGIPITSESNTVDDAISNITITLTSTGSTDLTIAHNTEKIKGVITDFVDLYNETRDLITRVREAKIDDEDLFGLFFSDPLLRQLFGEARSMTTSGVQMASGDWESGLSSQVATLGDTTMTIDGFSGSAVTLNDEDEFSIAGHSTRYVLQADATITAGSATVTFFPPLEASVTLGETVSVVTRTLEDIGIGVRSDTVSSIAGILGVIDEAKLDATLASDMASVKSIFNRLGSSGGSGGVARRLYDWIDNQVKISAFSSKKRSIDNVTIPGLERDNSDIDKQVDRLEDLLERKRTTLIRRFAEMENAISRSQAAGAAIGQAAAQSN